MRIGRGGRCPSRPHARHNGARGDAPSSRAVQATCRTMLRHHVMPREDFRPLGGIIFLRVGGGSRNAASGPSLWFQQKSTTNDGRGTSTRAQSSEQFKIVPNLSPEQPAGAPEAFACSAKGRCVGLGPVSEMPKSHFYHSPSCWPEAPKLAPELELGMIQTHMTQKPMLRVEVGARALRVLILSLIHI